jgi:SNF2 family DNA or RNA helicase
MRTTSSILSLKAGGVGLNLTAADYCIILDPWWNPAVEDQAIARAHRMGQTRPVMVYKYIVKDTIEEKILKLQEKKRQLFKNVIDEGELFGQGITEEDIREIFG